MMEHLIGSLYARIYDFFLIFIRLSGLFILSPIFGRRNIPATLKIGLILILTYLLIVIVPPSSDMGNISMIQYLLLCLKELLIGLILGYVTTLFFSAVLIAGQVMDAQIGFGMVQILDPQSNIQIPLLGNLLQVLALVAFFAINGHHELLKILFKTFLAIPPGTVIVKPPLVLEIIEVFAFVFLIAIKICIPVIAVALLSEIALGIIVRTVPQMNVFVVGIPLKIFLGLVILLVLLHLYIGFLDGVFKQMFFEIEKMLRGLM